MDYNELKKRIAGINYKNISSMDEFSMKMLTDNFKEPLVRRLIARAPQDRQKWVLSWIENKYTACYRWDPTPPYYFATIRFDIDCGIPITPKDNELDPSNTPEEKAAEVNSQAQKEITEPSKLVKQLQEQVEKLQTQLDEKEKTVAEQQRLIDDYSARFDPKDIKSKKVYAMTGKQHVILFLAVLAHHNRIPNARTNLSYLLSFIASRNESTMKDYLKERITQEECDALAKVFDTGQQISTDCPFIANLIRALPEKLQSDKSEKNRTKALKNNKE